MLIIGIQPQNILKELDLVSIPIILSNNEFLKGVANKIFAKEQLAMCWYPESNQMRSVHDLFNDAYISLQEGMTLDRTVIGSLLLSCLPISQKIIIWYGGDFCNLECVQNINLFLQRVSNELLEGSGEIYLRFDRA